MMRAGQTRRHFLHVLFGATIASASTSFATPPEQVSADPMGSGGGAPEPRAGLDVPAGRDNAPLVDVESMRRLPDLPGKVLTACFPALSVYCHNR
jgi:hypothetical protein